MTIESAMETRFILLRVEIVALLGIQTFKEKWMLNVLIISANIGMVKRTSSYFIYENFVHPPPAFGSSPDVELTLEVNQLHVQDRHDNVNDSRLYSWLTKLSKDQADYISVPVEGPYKPAHYRY
ncbi:hypothetical protein SO802_007533 [Lithocarpus litseifolius]|uniref:Uncharacterized protein n=1 Tax=Lithocarpus litseifolius TaxID=425828 RepID=A0AAW2DSZ4_9ROSI